MNSSLLLAQTAIPRRTGGWRLIDEPRQEVAQPAAWTPERAPAEPGVAAVASAAAPRRGSPEAEGRVRLRASMGERVRRELVELTGRLETMRAHMEREGVSRERVIPVTVMLSESVVLQELWREIRGQGAPRARMLQSLGLPAETDDAVLLDTLVDEVRQAFCELLESAPGLEALNAYDELLGRYEQAGLLLVVAGHDSGPLLGELARHGVKVDAAFTLSLLFEPRVLGVGAGTAAPGQVLVPGLNAAQLGQLVAQLRQLNPRLTNRQVRQVLLSVLGEMRGEAPRTLGHAQVERMHELARQLLRFKALEYLCP